MTIKESLLLEDGIQLRLYLNSCSIWLMKLFCSVHYDLDKLNLTLLNSIRKEQMENHMTHLLEYNKVHSLWKYTVTNVAYMEWNLAT